MFFLPRPYTIGIEVLISTDCLFLIVNFITVYCYSRRQPRTAIIIIYQFLLRFLFLYFCGPHDEKNVVSFFDDTVQVEVVTTKITSAKELSDARPNVRLIRTWHSAIDHCPADG